MAEWIARGSIIPLDHLDLLEDQEAEAGIKKIDFTLPDTYFSAEEPSSSLIEEKLTLSVSLISPELSED